MKISKFLKITGIVFFTATLVFLGIAIYFYQTVPMLKAIVKNDESKLYYFPSKKMLPMPDLDYSESVLHSEDTIKINTYSFKPDKKHKADLFLIYGGGGNITTYQDMIRTLVKNGFAVYAFDWRGFGKSNGTPGYKGLLKDAEVAFADFLTKKENNSLKTVIYGMSLGTQIAIKITENNEKDIDLLVLDGTVESAQALAVDFSPVKFLKNKAKNSPQDFNRDYVAVRDIANIKNTPKLFIHSKKDKKIPLIRGKNVYRAAKEPKTFWETETEHIMTLVKLPEETIKRIYRELNK
ncbi:MAG: hypothetical protein CSB55_06905 [Candidatus Cloacimonadota bacterium]|nr:MAG: hypothetical protein CSB55_06905 [Candidatus Cloacimonadota bacterium]